MEFAYDDLDTSRPIFSTKKLSSLKGIRLGSLNICSVYRKLDDVLTIIHNSELDYFSLTESWLNCSVSDADVAIDKYNVARLDRDGWRYFGIYQKQLQT